LDKIGPVPKISLFLYTRGGDTLAAWSIVNLLYQFADELEVIVPSRCLSSGTLMSLGAKRIIMTKQATLGPIDPSINHPLNPQIPNGPPDARIPVSVEEIEGYIQLMKEECEFNPKHDHNKLIEILSDAIHPIVLGKVYRTKSQIQMLATRLLKHQVSDKRKTREIIRFLCSESGSHDYTIHRKEARDELGLNIEKPDDELYALIKAIYDDIADDLELSSKFDPNLLIGQNQNARYQLRRALIESLDGGSNYYESSGTMTRQLIPQGNVVQNLINDQRTFEGWKYES
jgi:hypothetical protein